MKSECSKYIGLLFGLFNFLLFFHFFLEASYMEDNYELSWIYISFLDFPISLLFYLFTTLGVPINVSAIIFLGVLGSVWWYFLISYLINKFMCKEIQK